MFGYCARIVLAMANIDIRSRGGGVIRAECTVGLRQIHTPNPTNYTEKRDAQCSMIWHFLVFMKSGFDSQHCKQHRTKP